MHSIIWRRLDKPGHEFAWLDSNESRLQLSGTAVFTHEQAPCCLNYVIELDALWRTVSAKVNGFVGHDNVAVEISVDRDRFWRLNHKEVAETSGCTDVDLNFSPSTNLLPIRRLNLGIGESGAVRAAWLRFPSFELEPLDQTYNRTGESTYRYESGGGSFVSDLEVDRVGFVTRYPSFFEAEVEG